LDKLWAPWRIGYITGEKKEGCFLCEAWQNSQNEKNYVTFTTSLSFAILNTFPYNNGHMMAVPKRHVSSIEDLNDEEMLDLMKTVKKAIFVLRKVINPQGFNVGINIGKAAGAGIEGHLHIHIVPRWVGDTNFMSTCSSTKVISQSLQELYTQIKKWLPEKK